MLKNPKLIEALKALDEAFQAVDNASNGMTEDDDFDAFAENYPFAESFDDLSYAVHTWVKTNTEHNPAE